jgi:hypothetical protein
VQPSLRNYVSLLTNPQLDALIRSKGVKPPSSKSDKVVCMVNLVQAEAGSLSRAEVILRRVVQGV